MPNCIQTTLGQDWGKLHRNIQQRFNKTPQLDQPIYYKGNMDKVVCSKAGWLFAHFCRLIGKPLTPYQGDKVPVTVKLFKNKNSRGVFWQRIYHFNKRNAYQVVSEKKVEHGRMMECVGAGFGMFLDVYAHKQALHFKSTRYFLKIFGIYFSLPHCITPGQTHVIHQNLGTHKFRFTISIQHKQLGQTFYQTGVFHEST